MQEVNLVTAESETGRADKKLDNLLALHKQRYREVDINQYLSPRVTKLASTSKEDDLDFSEPLEFMLEARKFFIAFSGNPSFVGNFVTYQWSENHPYLTQYQWLVRVKASEVCRFGIDSAVFQELFRTCDNSDTRLNKNDFQSDFFKNRCLLMIDEDIEKGIDSLDQGSLKDYACVIATALKTTRIDEGTSVRFAEATKIWFVFQLNETRSEITNKLETNLCPNISIKQYNYYQTAVDIFEELKQEVENVKTTSVLVEDTPPTPEKEDVNCRGNGETLEKIYTEVSEKSLTAYLSKSWSGKVTIAELKLQYDKKGDSGKLNDLAFLGLPLRADEADDMSYSSNLEMEAKAYGEEGDQQSAQGKAVDNQRQKYTDDILEVVCHDLCRIKGWPQGFEGLYVDDGEIVIDVLEGTTPAVKSFLQSDCRYAFARANVNLNEAVIYVEQDVPSQYSVSRGDAICNIPEQDVFHRVKSRSDLKEVTDILEICPGHKQSYGTVACISNMPLSKTDSRYFIVTARHIFERGQITGDIKDEKECRFFCENDESLDHIANRCIGYLGGFGPNAKGIDIALLPVDLIEQGESDDDNDPIPVMFSGDISALFGHEVEHHGASTPQCKGIVQSSGYKPRIGSSPCEECLCVISNEKKVEHFSQVGDSGALVTRKNEDRTEAIGIISKRCESRRRRNGEMEPSSTYVVLLKNCFEAIESEFKIQLRLCSSWEDCRVKPIENNNA